MLMPEKCYNCPLMEKIGYDGLIKTLKKYDYEPVGIHAPQTLLELTWQIQNQTREIHLLNYKTNG